MPKKMDSFEKPVKRARGKPDGTSHSSLPKAETKSPVELKKTKGKFQIKKAAAKTLENVENTGKGVKRKFKDGGDHASGGKQPQTNFIPADKRPKTNFIPADKRPKTEGAEGGKKRKGLPVMRRMLKSNYDNTIKIKGLWEELRRHKLDDKKKGELCEKLMKIMKGSVKEYIFAHDCSRVVQSVFQHGSYDIRSSVYEELKGEILNMAKSKYAKFLVMKLIKYGTKPQKQHVYKSFLGNVRKMVKHTYAAEVLEHVYSDYCNSTQRTALIEEFYGPSFALFKTPIAQTLAQIAETEPAKKDVILKNMKESLASLTDKSVIQYSVVHKPFLEFFTFASVQDRAHMIEVLRELLVHVLHTRDGAALARLCLWHGDAKDRKLMLKSFKGHVVKMAREECGHSVILAALDCVDDTKLVEKTIIKELLSHLSELVDDGNARRVLLYLLSPRNPKYCHPALIRSVEEGDGNANSKKPVEQRRKELLEAFSTNFVRFVAREAENMAKDPAQLVLLTAAIMHASGDTSDAMRAVASLTAVPYAPVKSEDNSECHMVEQAAGHLTLKQLIKTDKDRASHGSELLFSRILVETVAEGGFRSWSACNRGCFLLVALLETEVPEVVDRVTEELKPALKKLEKVELRGAQVLVERLQKKP